MSSQTYQTTLFLWKAAGRSYLATLKLVQQIQEILTPILYSIYTTGFTLPILP